MDMKLFPRYMSSNCENAIRCFFDLNNQELHVYRELLEKGPGTAVEIGKRIERDRSTAYRSVTKLVDNQLVVKKTRNREGGGIFHVYEAVEPEMVQDMLIDAIEEWYRNVRTVVERTAVELKG
jgi:predicted transcriptional regulator